MISPQLIKILRSFSPEERESLNDFVYSPYFNKSASIHRLWEALKMFAPEFEDPDLSKEKIFEMVYGNKEYKYATIKNLIFTFTGLLEQFMELKSHERNKFQNEYNTLVYSIVRYLPEMFKKKFANIIKDYKNKSEGLDLHYLYKYLLIRHYTSFSALESKKNKILFEQGDSLIHFFLIHLFQVHYNIKVYYSSENYSQENNLVEKLLNILDLEKILAEIRLNNPKDFQIVNVHYYSYLCQTDPENDGYFYQYKKLLLSLQKTLHRSDFKTLSNNFLNILNERSFAGVKGTKNETAEFSIFLFSHGIDFGNTVSKISLITFSKNIKNFFEVLNRNYAEKFYERFKDRLIEKDKENMKNYYLAFLHYSKSEFDKALEYSSRIKMEIDRFKLSVKELQLKCYYELNETESFHYTLDAYRHLVSRNDFINNERKEYTKCFLRVINYLFEYKTSKKDTIASIKIEMKNKMLNKEWIFEKLKEIEK